MLKNHINNIHQESQRNFKCDSCGKSFKHIKKIHEGLEQKRHEYGSCGKSCSESRNLNQHINTIHVEQRNFKNIVKNLWVEKMHFNHVKNIHEDQRSYHYCDSCGKSFTTSAYLKFHINTVHVMQRNFKWYSCKKIFSFIAKSEKSCT